MSGRVHDRSHFYKYTSASTALIVIQSRSFRWSAPTMFNDPFDHQVGFVIDTDADTFGDLLAGSFERLIFNDHVPPLDPRRMLTGPILGLHSIRSRLPRQDIVREIRETAIATAQRLPDHLAAMNAALHHELCHSRVFCVNEVPDNVVMWSHYAEEHHGVVFMLRCDDALDNRLLAAQPVQYSNKFITFPSVDAYARHLTGEEPIDLKPLIWKMAYTKHLDWAYEREWRVHLPMLNAPPGDGYSLFEEPSSVFEAIYLGCRMPPSTVTQVVRAAREHLQHVRIFKAGLSRNAFTLEFNEIEDTEPL